VHVGPAYRVVLKPVHPQLAPDGASTDQEMRRVPEILGVYKPTTNYNSPPDFTIPYALGQSLVASGDARFVNRGKAISMRARALRAGSPECNTEWVAKNAKAVS
jgi:hypothetical protein